MIVSVARSVELDLPRGWRELPPASVLAGEDWVFEWIEESTAPAPHRARLAADLRIAASYVLGRDDERCWMLVTDPEDFSVVHGLASIVVQSSEDAADEGAATRFLAMPNEGTGAASWGRSTALATVGGYPAECVHEIAVAPFPGGADVVERCIATVFPDTAVQAARLELDVHSVDVYEDVVAVALRALSGIRFTNAD